MYLAVLNEQQRVLVVFDTERYVDEGAVGVEMPTEVFEAIRATGRFGDWVYNGESFVYDPETVVESAPPPTPATGELPTTVL